jgi:hypothetical protein
MKFIQEKLGEMGPVTYNLRSEDGFVDTVTKELTNVGADQQRCTIRFHQRISSRVFGESNFDTVLDLKEVEKITATSFEQELSQEDMPVRTIRPPIFKVKALKRHRALGDFLVDDEELANRLARAMAHAVELCTPDQKPELF